MNEPVHGGGDSEVPRVHPLEIPVIWFGIQFIELALIGPILWAFLGDDWPNLAAVAIIAAFLIGLTVINYKVRRRYIPR